MTPLTPTEIESLRIAIAEECGWKRRKNRYTDFKYVWARRIAEYTFSPPPYTTSLDAIQAAAMERFKTEEDKAGYWWELYTLSGHKQKFFHELSALDWCIALARTAKIWRFKE